MYLRACAKICPGRHMTFIYNVGPTSMQRHDVASTLRRCCINVMCLLGRIYIIQHMRNVSSGHLLSTETFYCNMILFVDRESPDQTARMRRVIWAFAVRICPKTCLHMARLIACAFYILTEKRNATLLTGKSNED